MPFSIHLNFDKNSEKTIKNIFYILKQKSLSLYMHESKNKPHIGLAIFNSYDERILDHELENFAKSLEPFSIEFQSIGIFPGNSPTVFLAPVFNETIRHLHEKLYEQINNCIKGKFKHYTPNNWIPHCTVGLNFDSSNLGKIIEEVSKISLPISRIPRCFYSLQSK